MDPCRLESQIEKLALQCSSTQERLLTLKNQARNLPEPTIDQNLHLELKAKDETIGRLTKENVRFDLLIFLVDFP